MARSVRDVALSYTVLAGPDGIDGYATSPPGLDTGVGATPDRELRVGWFVEPGFGPVDPDVAATVASAAEALREVGCIVEPVRIPAIEDHSPPALYSSLHVLETKPYFKRHAAGREADLFKIIAGVLDMPDTTASDFVAAEQAVEMLKDAFADFFVRYDAFVCPVTPFPAPPHDLPEYVVNGEALSPRSVLRATVPFNLTGLPAISLRFGTSRDGLPIGVQLVSRWFAESTVLHLARLLESVSPTRGQQPAI
jgi:aspartyl-tRNA(Asn)/glutamyl-tRNA(Gln) amidotransferase subunit A